MRRIERTAAFRRDYKWERRGRHRDIERILPVVVERLADDLPLPARCRDHGLSGRWSGFRECHLKPDLLLIYRKPQGALQLVRLGSHSELFG